MIHLPIAALLAGTLCAPANAPLPAFEPAALTVRADSVAELTEQYDESVALWRAELRAAEDSVTKRAIRKLHPATEFYPQFSELLEAGQEAAALWMIANVRLTGRSRAEADEVTKGLYLRLFQGELSNFGVLEQAAERMLRDRKKLGLELAVDLLKGSFAKAEGDETKALMAYSLGRLYNRFGGDENKQMGSVWTERAATDFADSAYGVRAADLLFESKFLSVGAVAPDFGGQSIDGTEIKLSDLRGKIVVVDFFGFW